MLDDDRQRLNEQGRKLGSLVLHFDLDGNPMGLGDWAALYEDTAARTLASTPIGTSMEVVTMWFGIDDSFGESELPRIIGTVTRTAAGEPMTGAWPEWTYPDRTAALEGHKQYCKEIHHVDV